MPAGCPCWTVSAYWRSLQPSRHWRSRVCRSRTRDTEPAAWSASERQGGEAIEELYRKIYLEGAKRANVFTVPRVMPSAPASQISMAYGIRGPVFTVSSACASSNHAIATAVWLLRNSVIDAAIAGGTEAPLTNG